MAQENKTLEELKVVTQNLKQFANSSPYDAALFDLHRRLSIVEEKLNINDKKQSSERKPDSPSSNPVLPGKGLVDGKSRKDGKVRERKGPLRVVRPNRVKKKSNPSRSSKNK